MKGFIFTPLRKGLLVVIIVLVSIIFIAPLLGFEWVSYISIGSQELFEPTESYSMATEEPEYNPDYTGFISILDRNPDDGSLAILKGKFLDDGLNREGMQEVIETQYEDLNGQMRYSLCNKVRGCIDVWYSGALSTDQPCEILTISRSEGEEFPIERVIEILKQCPQQEVVEDLGEGAVQKVCNFNLGNLKEFEIKDSDFFYNEKKCIRQPPGNSQTSYYDHGSEETIECENCICDQWCGDAIDERRCDGAQSISFASTPRYSTSDWTVYFMGYEREIRALLQEALDWGDSVPGYSDSDACEKIRNRVLTKKIDQGGDDKELVGSNLYNTIQVTATPFGSKLYKEVLVLNPTITGQYNLSALDNELCTNPFFGAYIGGHDLQWISVINEKTGKVEPLVNYFSEINAIAYNFKLGLDASTSMYKKGRSETDVFVSEFSMIQTKYKFSNKLIQNNEYLQLSRYMFKPVREMYVGLYDYDIINNNRNYLNYATCGYDVGDSYVTKDALYYMLEEKGYWNDKIHVIFSDALGGGGVHSTKRGKVKITMNNLDKDSLRGTGDCIFDINICSQDSFISDTDISETTKDIFDFFSNFNPSENIYQINNYDERSNPYGGSSGSEKDKDYWSIIKYNYFEFDLDKDYPESYISAAVESGIEEWSGNYFTYYTSLGTEKAFGTSYNEGLYSKIASHDAKTTVGDLNYEEGCWNSNMNSKLSGTTHETSIYYDCGSDNICFGRLRSTIAFVYKGPNGETNHPWKRPLQMLVTICENPEDETRYNS